MGELLERMKRDAVVLDGILDPVSGLDQDVLTFLKRDALRSWKGINTRLIQSGDPVAADGNFYTDTRQPFNSAAMTAVTLATTAKALWPVTTYSALPGGAYWWPGKELRVRAYGTITTAATPGNLTVSTAYGTADNTGLLSSSAAMTLVASQTAISWYCDAYFECRGVGPSGSGGSMFSWARFVVGTAVVAVGGVLIPAASPAAVNVDTTVASGINIQFARSGSTAETATVQDLIVQALN